MDLSLLLVLLLGIWILPGVFALVKLISIARNPSRYREICCDINESFVSLFLMSIIPVLSVAALLRLSIEFTLIDKSKTLKYKMEALSRKICKKLNTEEVKEDNIIKL